LQYNWDDTDYSGDTVFNAGIEQTGVQSADLSATGFSGTALAGYGFVLPHNFYIGAEVQGALDSDQEGSTTASAFFPDGTEVVQLNTNVKFLNNYGILLRPGYYLNTITLLFLRAGYVNGSFKVGTGAGELGGNNTTTQDTRVGGYLLGTGVETHITKGLGMRVEYDYINYETINTNIATTFSTPASGEIKSITANTSGNFSPQTGVVSLVLTYAFGQLVCR
jgi:opacity protein-like surface antigen